MSVIVILLSILASLGASITYFSFVFHTPSQTINLGATHYWEDYMYYISQFTQGAHGAWLNHAMYTEEAIPPTLLHEPNILLGKIGGIFHLTSMDTYNIGSIVLVFLFLILTYYCLKKLFPKPIYAIPAFLFFLFSASLMNRLPDGAPYRFFPFLLWNTPHYMFERLNMPPHYLIINILFLLSLLLLFTRHQKAWMNMTILGMLFALTILHPVASTLLVGTYWLTTICWKDHRDWKKTWFLTTGYLFGICYLASLYFTNNFGALMIVEAQWQDRTNLPFLLKSIGPIVPFAMLGMLFRLKKASAIERFGIILLPGVYITFLLPISEHLGISNARLLFPAQYLFWGWFAGVGLYETAGWLKSFVTYKKEVVVALLFSVFFISVAPTIIWELQQKLAIADAATGSMYYLPKTTYTAFQFLEQTFPYDALVVGNPLSFMDTRIPALSGHKTITGQRYATIKYEEKKAKVNALFSLSLSQDDALVWLTSHHVTYVLFTQYDGDVSAFQSHYPFLTPIFSTPTATVFKIQ